MQRQKFIAFFTSAFSGMYCFKKAQNGQKQP